MVFNAESEEAPTLRENDSQQMPPLLRRTGAQAYLHNHELLLPGGGGNNTANSNPMLHRRTLYLTQFSFLPSGLPRVTRFCEEAYKIRVSGDEDTRMISFGHLLQAHSPLPTTGSCL